MTAYDSSTTGYSPAGSAMGSRMAAVRPAASWPMADASMVLEVHGHLLSVAAAAAGSHHHGQHLGA